MSGKRVLDRLRHHARKIFDAALDAADPRKAVQRHLELDGNNLLVGPDLSINLDDFERVIVVGAGKASAPMAGALEDLLGDRIEGGLICLKYGHALPLKRVSVVEASHPVPDRAGEEAAARIIGILESAGEKDLVISCVSGGGSALLPRPAAVTLEQKQALTRKLLAVGADIHEINTVRKQLSLTKGGNLMRAAYPALVVNLVISDVIGDDLGTIASGPFAPDGSTFEDALEVLRRHGLLDEVDDEIIARIEDGVAGKIRENPREGDKIFSRVHNLILASNIICLNAMEVQACELGYGTLILSSSIAGDTSPAAHFHGAVAEEIHATGNPLTPPACLLSGGETTVKVTGDGLGGRNQEFALALVRTAARLPNTLFLSAGTDGTDGPTDAAGALVDSLSLARAISMGMDPDEYLRRNDSYHFFEKLGDLIVTGPTLTNVMDVRIVLVGQEGLL